MPTSRYNGFTINNLPVFGYGIERATSESPWFTAREYNAAVVAIDPNHAIIPQTFTKITDFFETLGYLETKRLRPAVSRGTKKVMQVTHQAREPLVDTLVHHVTHGHTLLELLVLPSSVDFILEETYFRNRLIKAASGLAVQSQQLQAS